MNSRAENFDKAFIARQLARLTKLHDELSGAARAGEAEESQVNEQASGEAVEYEDDAQRLTMLELDGNMVARDVQRLAFVDRALRKIEDGTYGFSDASGDPIPAERLEAMPEAIFTVEEQAAREAKS